MLITILHLLDFLKNKVVYDKLCLAYHRLQQYEKAIAKGKQILE
jgi:hypothetical protein